MFERFGPKYTASTVVLAVVNLKQRSTESCADFMAVDKTYYAVPNAASILSHSGAGLESEISKVVLSAATPPNTPAAMLAAAETVEAELSKKTTPGASALAVAEEETPDATDKETKEKPEPTMMETIEELVTAVNRFRPKTQSRGRGRGGTIWFDICTVVCYNCRKKGHFQRNCPEPQQGPRYSRGRGGPFVRGTFVTRRWQMRAPFGRDRATFHIEEEIG